MKKPTWLWIGAMLAGWMLCSELAVASFLADEGSAAPPVVTVPISDHSASALQCQEPPLVVAEGSNSCEIVSCGRGLKDTCKITCPANKTPKCSCDCLKSFGPMCTDYKANCTCE